MYENVEKKKKRRKPPLYEILLFILTGQPEQREYFLMRCAQTKWWRCQPVKLYRSYSDSFVTRNLFRTEIPLANTANSGILSFFSTFFFFAFFSLNSLAVLHRGSIMNQLVMQFARGAIFAHGYVDSSALLKSVCVRLI